ncbi:ankyrin repeat-containing domain protein, partial [Usnea florida]
KIVDWLAAPDPSTNYNRALKDRNPKTGSWFIEGSAYIGWKTTPGSFLWLYGTPGCGKTILSSTILQNVLEECEAKTASAVLYFYFDFNDAEKERHEKMIRSLISQLSRCSVGLHLLATSRRETDIEDSLNLLIDERNRISIQSALVNADIRTYTHDRLQNDRKLRRWLKHPEVQLEIEDMLVEKAAGMFRWAACQLDSLGNCFDLPRLRQALASLPRTLDDTYARILCTIDENYSDYNMQILKLLQWLTFSARPLRLEEFVETFAIDTNKTPRFDPERRLPEPRDVLTLCSSLITLSGHDDDDSDGESDTGSSFAYVRLAHFSVKEYLVSDRIRGGAASRFLNWIRIHDLDQYGKQELRLKIDDLASPLYYAALAGISEPVKLLIEAGKGVNVQGGKYGNALQAASYSGRTDIVQMLLDNGADIDTQGGEYGSALQAASFCGYINIVQLLLDNGADINAQDGHYGNALQVASSYGEIDIVQFLLDKGADINSPSETFGSALQAASCHGHINIVQLLLDNGADINAQGGYYGRRPALLVSIQRGHENVVKLLLEKGTDVNRVAEPSTLATVLQAASARGHETIVKMLLENGADVNGVAETATFGSALEAASVLGHETIVKILLENGADINARAGHFQTPLIGACYYGKEKTVQLLLDKGADTSAQGGEKDSAVEVAARWGHENIVKMLLDKGANAEGKAVQAAARRGHENIVKMLLDKGAN